MRGKTSMVAGEVVIKVGKMILGDLIQPEDAVLQAVRTFQVSSVVVVVDSILIDSLTQLGFTQYLPQLAFRFLSTQHLFLLIIGFPSTQDL